MYLCNFIETIYRELEDKELLSSEYTSLYRNFNDEVLIEVLSSLHANFILLFKMMNERLPTSDMEAHFWAEPSRNLINCIQCTERLVNRLLNTEYSLKIDDYYANLINQCKSFLCSSGGSKIPPHSNKIELYYKIPIFLKSAVIEKISINFKEKNVLRLIGEGSYARVYKYVDQFYKKTFAVKKIKSGIDEKSKERFKLEFDTMSKLSSPYIIEVYNYFEKEMQYVMEYLDYNLYDYITKNNLDKSKRKNIGYQILRGFEYINSKNILHRDISARNILIKKYDDTVVAKISDFGLVKLPSYSLTTLNSEIKGSFNDPNLIRDGFSNYSLSHEIYALTKLLYFVMTGKLNMNDVKAEKMNEFLNIGMNPDKSQRYKSLDELSKAFKEL